MVPGGLLVFFPSYGVMRTCVQNWKKCMDANGCSLWDRIAMQKVIMSHCLVCTIHVKQQTPLMEPQTKKEFVEIMTKYYELVCLVPPFISELNSPFRWPILSRAVQCFSLSVVEKFETAHIHLYLIECENR